MRSFSAILFLLLSAASAFAEIVVGVAGPFSGQNAVYGEELKGGVSAAISKINAEGGINGETLTLITGDDACDARRAVDVAKDFVAKDVRLVVGHFCSGSSLAAAPFYNSAGILQIVPSAGLPDITMKSLWHVFRLTGRDDMQGELAAGRIKAQGNGSDVILFSDGTADNAALTQRFKNAMPNARTITVKTGDARLTDAAKATLASAAYLALSATDAAQLARSLRIANPSIALYGSDLLQSEDYATRAEEAANGTAITLLKDWTSGGDLPRQAKLSTRDGAVLPAYAAVEVFAAAAKARSVNDGKAMAAWLSGGNTVRTIVGDIRFNASGDLQEQPYAWYTWTAGVLKPDPASP